MSVFTTVGVPFHQSPKFIHSHHLKKQSSKHIAALVTKLANVKVGSVAARKPASEMFKKQPLGWTKTGLPMLWSWETLRFFDESEALIHRNIYVKMLTGFRRRPLDTRWCWMRMGGKSGFRRALLFALLSSSPSLALSVILWPRLRWNDWRTLKPLLSQIYDRSLEDTGSKTVFAVQDWLIERGKYPRYGARNPTG